MQIRACGDSMLLVEFEPVIDPAINEHAIQLASRLRARRPRGVRDVVPGYCTVGIHFDPLHTDLAALERSIADHTAVLETTASVGERPVIEIAVEYGGVRGPDLANVAAIAGCSIDDVVARHTQRTYRVYMLGFVPGFAYMGRVDPSIATPRHRVPRERVAAGSVGIAGLQTGVYPVDSPGGWQLIGHTTAVMFDPAREQPSLLQSGDLVRFVATGVLR